jgi:hypothetical protein
MVQVPRLALPFPGMLYDLGISFDISELQFSHFNLLTVELIYRLAN